MALIDNYLADSGYVLDLCASGASAWQKIKTDPDHYEAVLLDRVMPDLDGLEVRRRIKADQALSTLPVILQTSRTIPKEVREGIDAGALKLESADFLLSDVIEQVATMCRESVYARRSENRATPRAYHRRRRRYDRSDAVASGRGDRHISGSRRRIVSYRLMLFVSKLMRYFKAAANRHTYGFDRLMLAHMCLVVCGPIAQARRIDHVVRNHISTRCQARIQ